jgi:glycosyltransferase involved in cell wall biosynthesis
MDRPDGPSRRAGVTPSPSPRVSVVITTHDRPEFARRAIASARAQTMADLEIVVVDDASVSPIAVPSDDPRVRLVRREHAGGMCAARNAGLASARGAWVTFLDDDDELAPEMLEQALGAAERSPLPPPVVAMGGMAIVRPDGTEIERCRPPTLRRGQHYLLSGGGDFRAKNALVLPTDLVRSIGGWNEDLRDWEADDFGLRLNAAASIVGVDAPLYRLTQHAGPRVSRGWGGIARDMERTMAEHGRAFRAHRAEHAQYMARVGIYHLKAGHWGSAVAWCARGVLRDPRRLRRWRYLGAALAGPRAVSAYRRLRPRDATVSDWVLARRRARKYAGRLLDRVRVLPAAPLAWVTAAVARRRQGSRPAAAPRAVLVLCIYRAHNADRVAVLAAEATARGWDLRLWALDTLTPELAANTVGVSAGAKFPLLNELVAGQDLEVWEWIVVADDDVVFPGGDLGELLATAEAAGLDFVQPAHTEVSHRENEIGVRRPLAIARRTTFVEIGPVFAVRRPWASQVLPFPGDHQMGWGLELEWFDLERRGARLGIVDAVAVRHLGAVGRAYAKEEERAGLRARLDARGIADLHDIQRTEATWWAWQAAPPWRADR